MQTLLSTQRPNYFTPTQANHVSYPTSQYRSFHESPSIWYPDIGATHHITLDLSSLSITNDYSGNDQVQVANGQGLPISHTGSSFIHTPHKSLHLNHVLHVRHLTKSLLSVNKFTKDNSCFFEFYPNHFSVKDQETKTLLLKGLSKGGLYTIDSTSPSAHHTEAPSIQTWHECLGHPQIKTVSKIIKEFKLPCHKRSTISVSDCVSCRLGKLSKFLLASVHHKSQAPFQIVYSDIWGPAPMPSSTGYRYFVIFVDEYTRFS